MKSLTKRIIVVCAVVAIAAIGAYSYLDPAKLVSGAHRGDGNSTSIQTPGQSGGEVTGNPAVRPVVAKGVAVKEDSWSQRFYKSSDYYAFVSQAAVAGLNGDGRAAYFVSKAVSTCAALKIEYGQAQDPNAAFETKWAERANAPKWLLDKARAEFQSCVGMIKGDAFAALPAKPNGYWSASYWQDQAYAAGDPLAQSIHAGDTLSKTQFETATNANVASFASAQADINNAVASKDAAALFQVGQILSDGHYTDSKTQGFAIAIAACELGYDCSANNAALGPYLGCVPIGTCAPGMNYSDVIKRVVGERGYAEVYAQAQALKDALSRGDQDAAQAFVRLKSPT